MTKKQTQQEASAGGLQNLGTDTSQVKPEKRTRKRNKDQMEVRAVRDINREVVALVYSKSDQEAIEHHTGKHTAEIVNALAAVSIAAEFSLKVDIAGQIAAQCGPAE